VKKSQAVGLRSKSEGQQQFLGKTSGTPVFEIDEGNRF